MKIFEFCLQTTKSKNYKIVSKQSETVASFEGKNIQSSSNSKVISLKRVRTSKRSDQKGRSS